MEEIIKKSPGRPKKDHSLTNSIIDAGITDGQAETAPPLRKVRYAKVHDAFAPLREKSFLSLSNEQPYNMELLEGETGIEVCLKGRSYVVPYANISFYEVELG